jgi:hypothetical protein
MPSPQHTNPAGARTMFQDVVQWARALTHLHSRIAPHFARKEPRRRALAFLQGIFASGGTQKWLATG